MELTEQIDVALQLLDFTTYSFLLVVVAERA